MPCFTISLQPRHLAAYEQARAFYLQIAGGSFNPLPPALHERATNTDPLEVAAWLDALAFKPDPKYAARAPDLPPADKLSAAPITADQLADFAEAVELLCRWGFGQLDHLPMWVTMAADVRINDTRTRFLRRLLFPEFAHPGESFGIGRHEGNPTAQAGQLAYELWKASMHELMKLRRAECAARGDQWYGTTHDDGHIFLYSGEPRPVIAAAA